MKRVFSLLLCILMVITSFEFNTIQSKADGEKWVYSDTDYISFGNVDKSESVHYQIVDIYNFNDEAVDLMWYVSDPDKMLDVDAPDTLHLEPDEQTQFWIGCNTDISSGTHYAEFYVSDKSDPSCMYGVCVNASVTIKDKTPYISSVSISPKNISLTKNSSVNFTANVSGGNDYSSDVEWSIVGTNSNSSIDGSGKLSIGSNESASTITVRATSKADRNYYDDATVTITKNTYSITTSASPSNGGAVSGGGTVNQGDNVTLVASPYSGYQFVRWKKDGNEVGKSTKLSVNNINANGNYVAEFKQVNCKVHVTSNHSYGGNTSGDVTVGYGSEVTITASANPGYKFDGWYENNNKVSSDTKYKVTNITSDRTFTAVFNQCQYNVSAQVSPSEGGKVSGTGKYNQGDTVKLKATPNNGYSFSGWFLNGNEYSKNPEISIGNVGSDYNFIAYFMKQGTTTYNLASSTGTSDGTISPAGNYLVPQGSNVTYAITPKSGYLISDVKVDNVSVGAVSSYTFTNVTSQHSIVAYFMKQPETNTNKDVHKETNNTANNTSNNTTNNTANNSNQNASVPSTNKPVENSTDYSREVLDYNLDDETGIMQEYNVSDSQVIEMVRNGQGKEMFEKAIADGTFELSVYNELGNNTGTVQSIGSADVSVPNIESVIGGILTDEDLIAILHSKKVAISINLFDSTGSVSDLDKRLIDNTMFGGMRVDKYFDVLILKSVDGTTTELTNLNVPMTLVINVPDEFKGVNKSFYIIRSHTDENGITSTDILTDEDGSPDTITFTSDKFSAYALVYIESYSADRTSKSTSQYTNVKNAEKKDKTSGIVVLVGTIAGLVVTLGIANVVVAKARRKRKKKK